MNNNESNLIKNVGSIAGVQISKSKNLPTEKYADPEKTLEERKKKNSYQEELENQEIEDRKSNRRLKQGYADKMFWYMCIWSIFIAMIIIVSGLEGIGCIDFQLSQ